METQQQDRSLEGWPFLLGKNKVNGYEVIVAPRALYTARLWGMLATLAEADGNLTSFGYAFYRDVVIRDSAPLFSILFHVILATERFIGDSSDRPLKDREGRLIQLIEGIVFRAGTDHHSQFPSTFLLAAHDSLVPSYERYWKAIGPAEVEASDGLKVRFSREEPMLQIVTLDAFQYDNAPNLDWSGPPNSSNTTKS